jgi:serine/threonine-protein kinase
MTISPGSRLAHYEVSGLLGAGGMGEVWRAKDTKLGRDVAIKVLPEAFTRDAERLARFEREARVLASVDHTSIASIYGIEEADGQRFLVMQLASGEDLSERIRRGPVPPDDAIAIARQIAEALEAAHEKGIIHRDLKPANVKVDDEGNVTILDFGLAKAMDSEDESVDLTNSPTMVKAATHSGMILGTAAYMSPEQAAGKKVDKRTDVWAFGVVLYEMLTVERLFRGDTVSELLAAVLRDEPDFDRLPPGVPLAVRRLVGRCLTRNPKERLRDIGEARIALEKPAADDDSSMPPVAPAASETPMWPRLLPWLFAVAGVLFGLSVMLRSPGESRTASATSSVTAFGVTLPQGYVLRQDETPVLDISPDGRTLVFVAEGSEGRTLFVRRLDQPVPQPIEGTAGARSPFLSPDGQSVGFVADGKIRKVPINGGSPVDLGNLFAYRGATWAPGGWIVFTKGYADGLFKVRDSGGSPEPITALDEAKNERSHRWPTVSPDGRWVVFTVGDSANPSFYDESPIAAVNLATGERKTVYRGAMCARFAGAGRLVLQRKSSLFVIDVDPETLEVRSEPRSLRDDVGGEMSSGAGYYAMSATGSLAYVPGSAIPQEKSLVLVGLDGRETPLPLEAQSYWQPRYSPDGNRLAVSIGSNAGTDAEVWTYDFDSERLSRLTFQPGRAVPLWSPDGTRIVYTGTSDAVPVMMKPADGSGEERAVELDSPINGFAQTFTPDGESVVLTTTNDIKMVRLELETGKSELVFDDPGAQWGAAFSPDGRFLAYVSTETGVDEIFVKTWPIGGGKWQVSTNGGQFPLWSSDGRTLYFIRDGVLFSCDVDTSTGAVRAGQPRELLRGPYELRTAPIRNFDLAPDGRFIFARQRTDVVAPRQLEVVLGWEGLMEKRNEN